MVVNEHDRNLAKGTLHELPPLTVKRSNYTHISSPDAFGGSIARRVEKCAFVASRTELPESKRLLYSAIRKKSDRTLRPLL